jgi:hypothetical protein
LDILIEQSLGALFVGSLAVFAAASEIGHALGLRDDKEANVATLEAAVLGLLALMLSFTFAMAVSRFDDRREAVLEEANAIGTAALRARLLPAPHNAESLKLLQQYAGLRVETATPINASGLDARIERSNALQERLWKEAGSAVAKDNGMVPTGLYIQALNKVFDDQQSRVVAYRRRVPSVIFLALYGIAAIGIGFAGFASGLERRRWRLPVYTVNLLAALVILLIQDLDRPDSGSIVVDQQPMIDTAKALASYRVEPAPERPSEPARRPAK